MLSRDPAAFITDVDGTISNIVEDASRAEVEPRVLDALEMLSEQVDRVVLLSGRSVLELRQMVPISGISLIGNHGLETWAGDSVVDHPSARAFIRHIEDAEACLLAEHLDPGVILENKRVALAIHYRRCSKPAETRARLLDVLSRCPAVRGLRLTEGRMVLELLPPIPVDKGTSVEQILASGRTAGAVYLGDDTTDLDAFQKMSALRQSGCCATVSIAVQSDEAPRELVESADYVLDGVDEASRLIGMAAAALGARSR